MPHLTVEFTSNIFEKDTLKPLFQECHALLAEMLPTKISSCQSRASEYVSYYIGEGEKNNAFVHVILKILPGRTPEILKKVGESLIELFTQYFERSATELNLKISLEIIELKTLYFKS